MPTEYGCLYCGTGHERNVVNYLTERNIKAISPIKYRFRRRKKKLELEKVILFPGYVFFSIDITGHPDTLFQDLGLEADYDQKSQEYCLLRILRSHFGVIKILFAGDKWSLEGADKEFVEQLFAVNGEIGISKACFVGDKIHIQNGFLEKYEGAITAVNRRAKTARIVVTIKEKEFCMWLGFEE